MRKSKIPEKFVSILIIILLLTEAVLILLIAVPSLIDTFFFNTRQKPLNGEKMTIAFIAPKTNNKIWMDVKNGFFASAEFYGFYPIWLEESQTSSFNNNVNISIAGKPEAIIFDPAYSSCDTTNLIHDSKIPTVFCLTQPLEILYNSFVGIDFTYTNARIVKEITSKGLPANNISVIINTNYTGNEENIVNDLYVQISAQHKDANLYSVAKENTVNALVAALTDPKIDTIVVLDESDDCEMANVIATFGNAHHKTIVLYGNSDQICSNLLDTNTINVLVVPAYYRIGYLAGEFAFEKSTGKIMPKTYNYLPRINTSTGSEFYG